MLNLTDQGCKEHHLRHLMLKGYEAELIEGILYSLPREEGFHTFICEYGHTHRLSFYTETEKMAACRPSRPRMQPGHRGIEEPIGSGR